MKYLFFLFLLTSVVNNQHFSLKQIAATEEIIDLTVSPDGSFLIACSIDSEIKIYQNQQNSWKLVQLIDEVQQPVSRITISGDSNTIASINYHNQRGLSQQLKILKKKNDGFHYFEGIELDNELNRHPQLSIDHKGNLIAIASSHGQCLIYKFDGHNYKLFQTITAAEEYYLQNVKLSPDGQYLITGGHDKINRLYKYNGSKFDIIQTIQLESNIQYSHISIDYKTLILVTSNSIKIYYLNQNGKYQQSQILKIHQSTSQSNQLPVIIPQQQVKSVSSITTAMASDDGNYFLLGTNDRKVILYKKIGNQYTNIKQFYSEQKIRSISISNNANFLAVLDKNGKIYTYLQCNIQKCTECSWANQCTTCQKDFILIDGKCQLNFNWNITLTTLISIAIFIIAILIVLFGLRMGKKKYTQFISQIALKQDSNVDLKKTKKTNLDIDFNESKLPEN